MKAKMLLMGAGLAVVLVVAAACTQDGNTTPTATENPSLTSVTAEAKVPVLLCHHNPDLDDYLPEWHVIEVSSRAVGSHCENHGDFKQVAGSGCGSCDLSYFGAYVGQDCSYCEGDI